MNLIISVVVSVLFGAGVYLLLKRDLLRNVAGLHLTSNSVILFILSAGISRGEAPILPLEPRTLVSDPLAQAMVLTAVVINFSISTLVLSLIYRVYKTHDTLDQEIIHAAEKLDIEEEERQRAPEEY